MNSNIDQEVLDELITMLEGHIAGGMKKPEDKGAGDMHEAMGGSEGDPMDDVTSTGEMHSKMSGDNPEDDEDMKALMEMYSKG